jgi:adenine-specific DNA glycosylase
LGEGEYIEEDVETFVETKVGQFSFSQTKRVGNTGYEAIISGDIVQQSKVDSVSETYKRFSEKYGIKTPAASSGKPTSGKGSALSLSSVIGSLSLEAPP